MPHISLEQYLPPSTQPLPRGIGELLSKTELKVIFPNKKIEVKPPAEIKKKPDLKQSLKNLFTKQPPPPIERASLEASFNRVLIKEGLNTWHIVENTVIGEGAFGQVFLSTYKLVVDPQNQITIEKTDNVVKILDISKCDSKERQKAIDDATSEHEKMVEQKIQAANPLILKNNICLVMENRGASLDKCMPRPEAFDFDTSFNMVHGLLNEVFLLQGNSNVHRDLKPANICRKTIVNRGSTSYQYSFIDYGLSVKVNASVNAAGTPLYVPPESLKGALPDFRFDIYAMAGIFLEIFAAKFCELKSKASRMCENIHEAPYSTAGIFGGALEGNAFVRAKIPAEVDTGLLEDIKLLFMQMSSNNPNKRPTVKKIFDFIAAIPYRRQLNAAINREKEEFDSLYNSAGFTAPANNPVVINSHRVEVERVNQPSDTYPQYTSCSIIRVNSEPTVQTLADCGLSSQAYIYYNDGLYYANKFTNHCQLIANNPQQMAQLDELLKIKTQGFGLVNHLQETEKEAIHRITGHRSFDVNLPISKQLHAIRQFHLLHKVFADTFVYPQNPFKGTNSFGIAQIQAVLNDKQLTPIAALKAIKQIAINKTTNNLANRYNRSSFFGQGRHQNIEELYIKLAAMNVHTVDSAISCLTTVNEWVKSKDKTFVAEEGKSCCFASKVG